MKRFLPMFGLILLGWLVVGVLDLVIKLVFKKEETWLDTWPIYLLTAFIIGVVYSIM